MGFAHGTNDATKTMGIITLALVGATKAGLFHNAPGWLTWLHTPEGADPFSLNMGARAMSWLPLRVDGLPSKTNGALGI